MISLHILTEQFEISDTSSSYFLIFIHNITCDHYYFVKSFGGDVLSISNGDDQEMVKAYEKVESKVVSDGYKAISPAVVDRVCTLDEGREEEVRSALSMAINSRYLTSLLSALRGSHDEQMKKKNLLPRESRYQSWGDWA